jgi:hypothetical protein
VVCQVVARAFKEDHRNLKVGNMRCAFARRLQGRKDGDVRAELLDELAAWTRDALARDGELNAERPV